MSIEPNLQDEKLSISNNTSNETSFSPLNSNKGNDNPSENAEFLEKLEEYYKLKNDYDMNLQTKKNSILKDDSLTMKEKQDKYNKLKLRCINCKQNVGTIFENNEGVLSAVCGDKTKPCNLNIKIFRGKFLNLDVLIDTFQGGVDDTKEDIIKTKLDLLFGYENENNTVKKFNKFKAELTQELETVMEYKTLFIEKTTNLENKSTIIIETDKLFDQINLIKSTVQEYNETDNIQLIKDMITNVYITQLLPLLLKIRNLKYKYMAMQYNRDLNIYKLAKKKYTLEEMLVAFENPKIENFEIGVNNTKQTKEKLQIDNDNEEEDDWWRYD